MAESKDNAQRDPPFRVQRLSDDCLLRIYSFLSPQELLVSAQSCKWFNGMAQDSALWRAFFQRTFPTKSPQSTSNSPDWYAEFKLHQTQVYEARRLIEASFAETDNLISRLSIERIYQMQRLEETLAARRTAALQRRAAQP